MRSLGRSWRILLLFLAPLAVVLVLMAPGGDRAAAEPDTVNAGHDLLETDASDTYQDFGVIPIPADFFDPGSDPFTDQVYMEGVPFDSFAGFHGLTPTDTIVERKADAGAGGFPDTIDIEIVRLELKSVNPITVTYDGGLNPELWELTAQVDEGPDPAQSLGSMTIRHDGVDGGTFDSVLPVTPRLTFTRQSDGAVRTWVVGPIDFTANNVPWCHTANPLDNPPGHVVVEVPGLTSNFFPGIDCSGLLRVKIPVGEAALIAKHTVRSAEVAPAVGGMAELPALAGTGGEESGLATEDSGWSAGAYAALAGAAAAVAVALAAGAWYTRRRRLG